ACGQARQEGRRLKGRREGEQRTGNLMRSNRGETPPSKEYRNSSCSVLRYGHQRREREIPHIAFGTTSKAWQAPPLQTKGKEKWRPEGRLYGRTERKKRTRTGAILSCPYSEKGDICN